MALTLIKPSGLDTTGNFSFSNVSVSGNVTANYFIGDGSQLTGLPASYSNTNVAAYLPTYTGNVSANYFIGDGSTLTFITGSNVNGQVGNSLVAGTVYTNAQPNITSVGTLSSLSVTSNVTAGNISGGNLVSANYISGTLTTQSQPNITSVGTLSNVTVSGNITTNNISVTTSETIGAAANGSLSVTNDSTKISIPVSTQLTSSWTISMWVYLPTQTINYTRSLWQSAGGQHKGYIGWNGTTTWTLTFFKSGVGYIDYNLGGAPAQNTWHFVTFSYDSATSKVYVGWNGTVFTSGTFTISSDGDLEFFAGGNSSSPTRMTDIGFQTSLNYTSNFSVPTSHPTSSNYLWLFYVTSSGTYLTNSGTAGGSATLTGSGLSFSSTNPFGATGDLTVYNSANLGNSVTATYFTGTLITQSQPNITSVGTLSSLSVTANITSGNISGGNLVSANYISGNGSLLTSITAGNVTGQVGNALVAGTVYTASQPNITSVGTLSSLSVTANITSGNISGGNLVSANYISGNGSLLTSLAGGNVTGQVGNSLVAGTVYTQAQPNITSLGTLVGLGVSGNIDITGNINVTGNLNYSNVSDLVVGDPLIYIGANNTGNLYDLGIVASYNDGSYYHTGLARNHDTGTWSIFDLVVNEPTTTIDWANGIYGAFRAGNITAGNVNGGNLVSANYISGNGSLLSSITGSNVTGQVGNSLVSGTVYTAAQPNITSTGTLVSLNVSGNVTASYFIGDGSQLTGLPASYSNANVAAYLPTYTGNVSAAYFSGDGSLLTNLTGGNVTGQVSNALVAGTVYTNAQPNITSVGTLASLTVTGLVTATGGGVKTGNIIDTGGTNTIVVNSLTTSIVGNLEVGTGGAGNVTATYFIGNGSSLTSLTGGNVTGQVSNSLVAGTVYTAAQPNITSVGTLASVSVTANASAGNILTDNLLYANGTAWAFGSGTPGGSNTEVQFNDNGSFGGNAGFTFNKTSTTLTANNFVATTTANLGAVGNITITGGTANYVLSTDGSGTLSWVAQSGGGGGGANITNDTTTNSNYYPVFTTTTSGTMTTANVSTTKFYFNPNTGTLNSTIFNSLSDKNTKTELVQITNALDKLKQLTGYVYTIIDSGERSAGLLSQDVEKVLPEAVRNNNGIQSLNYNATIALIVESIKILSDKIDDISKGR